MKKIIFFASLLVVSWTAAYSDDDPKTKTKKNPANSYCAKMKDGMLRVEHEGTILTEDVTLANGTQIKTDGTIIKKDGTRNMLKEGQCVDLNGDTSTGNFNGEPVKGKNKSNDNSGTNGSDNSKNNDNTNGGANGNNNKSGDNGTNGSSKSNSKNGGTKNSSGKSKTDNNSTNTIDSTGNNKK